MLKHIVIKNIILLHHSRYSKNDELKIFDGSQQKHSKLEHKEDQLEKPNKYPLMWNKKIS